ncbi:unnamed protein product [Choristocarpus tenellus]
MTTIFAASKWIAKARRIQGPSRGRQDSENWRKMKSYSTISDRDDPDQEVGVGGDKDIIDNGPIENGEEEGELWKLWHLLMGNPINVMLIFVPLAFIVKFAGCSDTTVFVINFLAMMPLASMLGDFTEEVSLHTNQTVGGLIQATLGNTVEIVVSLQALYANQIRVVQASLLGSVFSNLLLVLGCCFFFGGLKFKEQKFNSTSAIANMSLLLLSSLALVLPTPLSQTKTEEEVLVVSRFTGVFLLAMYAQLMIFQV